MSLSVSPGETEDTLCYGENAMAKQICNFFVNNFSFCLIEVVDGALPLKIDILISIY